MQRKHKEEQQLQAYLKIVVETHYVEHATQKARKVAKANVREKAKK